MINDNMTCAYENGDLVYIPSNVSLLKEEGDTGRVIQVLTTNEPDYGLIVSNKDKHNRYLIFWNGENWFVKEEDIFPLDFSATNNSFGGE